MEEWKEYNFNDITINYDKNRIPLSSKERETRKGEYRYFGAQGVIDYVDDYIFDGQYILLAEDGENLKSKKQSLVQFVSGKFWVNNHAHILTGNEKCDIKFLFYLLDSIDFTPFITGSAQPKLSQQSLSKIYLKLPPLPTQQKIAAILSSLDDKIELNNKINTNLEHQAQALFKNWFVDNSNLYQKMPLGKVVSKANVGGDAIKKTPIVEEDTGIRCIRIGDLTNKRPYKEWGFAKVSDENFTRYKLHKYDIVLARTAVLGLNRIIHEDLNAVYNNGMIKLEANSKLILPLYLYSHMNTQDYKNYMNRIVAETSVRPNMKANYLLDYQLIVPDIETQKRFEKIAKGIYEQINNNEKENDRLSSLRDTLLPKLMNGEIEV